MLTILKTLIPKSGILCVLFAIGLLSHPILGTEQPKVPAPQAPVPSPIVTAKKVFISNAPGQNLPASLGGPDRTYNEFYAAMKSWGRYELVSAPADADMIFEISLASSIVGVGGTSSSGCSSSSEADLRLAILDAKTRVPLWWFAEPIIQKRMMFHAEKAGDAFSDTLPKLLDDIRKLLGQPAVSLDGEKR